MYGRPAYVNEKAVAHLARAGIDLQSAFSQGGQSHVPASSMTPADVQAEADRFDIALAVVEASDPSGRVSVGDVRAAAAAAASTVSSPKQPAQGAAPGRATTRSTADAYPALWEGRPHQAADRTFTLASSLAAPGSRSGGSGAGIDYPAHWDVSPIDVNEGGPRAERDRPVSGTAGSSAGIDYPADWAVR